MSVDKALEAYKKFVEVGIILDNDTYRERLLLGSLGINTEAGELGDIGKKIAFHGENAPSAEDARAEAVLEAGDVLWYFTVFLDTMGITWDEVVAANIDKLTKRYPERHIL